MVFSLLSGLFGGGGRKSSAPPPPSPLSTLEIRLPGGDRITQKVDDGNLVIQPVLSAFNRRELSRNQKRLSQLSQELVSTPSQEAKRIAQSQQAFFEKLRRSINESANLSTSKTQSDLAKRFGGSLNTTFGNDLLARIEKNRLGAITDAQADASLYGQELFNTAQQSRMQKIQLLQGQLNSILSPSTSLLPYSLRNAEMMRNVAERHQERQENRSLDTMLGVAGLATRAIGAFIA